ncbi:hypothetical protein QBC39DRAFT_417701 [Podospora conica]|nr:hypothetical protein QBC39DRAFT_417701 [Schizothecium conicum]
MDPLSKHPFPTSSRAPAHANKAQSEPPVPLAARHQHHQDLPADIKARCADITAAISTRISSFNIDKEIVVAVRALRADSEAKGLWHQCLAAIPFPSRYVIQAIADTKAVPDRFAPRIQKLCDHWRISREEFDEFFFGAVSTGFFESLTKLVGAIDEPWVVCRAALSLEREKRLKGEVPRAVPGLLWVQGDVHRTVDALKALKENVTMADGTMPDGAMADGTMPGVTMRNRNPRKVTKPKKRQRDPRIKDLDADAASSTRSCSPSPERARDNPEWERRSASPATPDPKRTRTDEETAPMDHDDMAPSPTILSPRPDSPAPDSFLPDFSLAKSPAFPSLLLEELSPPARDPTLPSLGGIWGIGPTPTEVLDLYDNKGWLSGTILDMAIEACCAVVSGPPVVPVLCLLFAESSRPDNHRHYIERLRRQVATNEEISFLLPINVHGNHWALGHLSWRDKTAEMYDSMSSRENTRAVEKHVRFFIEHFLGDNSHQWQLTLAACPQQQDTSACGIFTIANAMYLVLRRSLPAPPYHTGLWRSALSCLVSDSNNKALWPYTEEMDRKAAAVSASPSDLLDAKRVAQAWEVGFASGATISDALALAARIVESTKAAAKKALPNVQTELDSRRSVLGELRVLRAFVDAARKATTPAPSGPGPSDDGDTTIASQPADRNASIEEEMTRYCNMRDQLSKYPEMAAPGQINKIAAKITELEKAKAEKDQDMGKDKQRRGLAGVVVERLGACIDTEMARALASVSLLEAQIDAAETCAVPGGY